RSKGVVVTDVVRDGVADSAGLGEGDLVTEIDRKVIAGAADAAKALEKPGKHLVKLRSPRGSRTLTITTPAAKPRGEG
ncbi:MAG TPA: PDZ domain-containing protein, partial [Archangium sp.]